VLVDSLARVRGDFSAWDQGRWEFTGDASVLSAFDPFADSAVVALTNCLDRDQPANATARGKPVAHGVMCFWALRRLAYYEGDSDSAFEDTWPGEIEPTATLTELRAAKEAWLRIIRAKSYHLT
jgi:hypothetical protein